MAKMFTNIKHDFDADKFVPVSNCTWHDRGIKPAGGMWLSINEGWERWWGGDIPLFEMPRWQFELSSTARILTVDSMEVLASLPVIEIEDKDWYDVPIYHLDFEKLAESYDMIEVMVDDRDLYYALDGWDVDSAVVFNPDIIISSYEIDPFDNKDEYDQEQEEDDAYPGMTLLTDHGHRVVWGTLSQLGMRCTGNPDRLTP